MMKSNAIESRLKILLVVFIFCFGFLWMRLFHLQVLRGDSLRKLAEANRTSILFESAPRGLILDRNRLVIADSRPVFVVFFTPLKLTEAGLNHLSSLLSKILDVDANLLLKRLRHAVKQSSMIRLLDHASQSVAFALAEQRPNLPGVSVATEMQRRYPNGPLCAHLLGYLGKISPKEFEILRLEQYQQNWLIGKMGLEKIYDPLLRGEAGGMRIEVDAAGRSVQVLDKKEAVAGYQITTTIDLNLQKAAEQALLATGKPGSVVALNPNNGEVLVFASAPSFDPNAFLYHEDDLEDESLNPSELLVHPDLPLYNRAILGAYPPGSIFKIMVAAAALEGGKINPQDSVVCKGSLSLGGGYKKNFLCWKKEGHGRMNLAAALKNSCNIYFYQVGVKVGAEAIEQMARKFGLGVATSLDFQMEKSGQVPSPKMFGSGQRHWYDGDTMNLAIGQGTLLVTPIQAAQMISLVASHGKQYRLRLVQDIQAPDQEIYARSAAKQLNQIYLKDSTWTFLDQALTLVVDSGTGVAAKINGIPIAGKTGTAQNPRGDSHAWFVCYAPVEHPTIAIAVFVEHGKKGSEFAAPVARQILEVALHDQIVLAANARTAASAPLRRSGDLGD